MAVAEIRQPSIPHRLPPSALVSTAEIDLRHRVHNRLAKEDKSLEQPVYYRYHFLGKHVRPAKSVADLLRRARRGLNEGVWRIAGDRWLLYNDIDTLDQAIALAEAREGSLTTTSTEGGQADGCKA